MPAKKSAAFLLVEQQAFISPFASQKYLQSYILIEVGA